jgi:hypothetical protein
MEGELKSRFIQTARERIAKIEDQLKGDYPSVKIRVLKQVYIEKRELSREEKDLFKEKIDLENMLKNMDTVTANYIDTIY